MPDSAGCAFAPCSSCCCDVHWGTLALTPHVMNVSRALLLQGAAQRSNRSYRGHLLEGTGMAPQEEMHGPCVPTCNGVPGIVPATQLSSVGWLQPITREDSVLIQNAAELSLSPHADL